MSASVMCCFILKVNYLKQWSTRASGVDTALVISIYSSI